MIAKQRNKKSNERKGSRRVKQNWIANMENGRPSSEWTFPLLERFDREASNVAADFKLDTYPNQIEIVTSEQMIDAYASTGMPVFYPHWSFGKQYVQVEKQYRRGQMGLAYELVINSNPCIAYYMQENSMAMQGLVNAHASYGHNSFFKGNFLFRQWTQADAIVDYLVFAKDFITKCEEEHGIDKVEVLLDACHALMEYGVNPYKRPQKLSLEKEKQRQKERADYRQSQVSEFWMRMVLGKKEKAEKEEKKKFVQAGEEEDNILYFVEKNSPVLEPWEGEIVRIVRKIAQYLYPQGQTKVMNEGWATFWHYTILKEMYNRGFIPDGFMIEMLHAHTGVISQHESIITDEKIRISDFNPYALGFNLFSDLRRICEEPTREDKKWFPDIAGSPWIETLDYAMRNFKDESFIQQYLSPKLIRDMKMWAILDDPSAHPKSLVVSDIHDEDGYREIRKLLADQYTRGSHHPNIQVWDVNIRTNRALTLRHTPYNKSSLEKRDMYEVLRHLFITLWGHPVIMESPGVDGSMRIICQCPEINPKG